MVMVKIAAPIQALKYISGPQLVTLFADILFNSKALICRV
jgi:hypothetical protein